MTRLPLILRREYRADRGGAVTILAVGLIVGSLAVTAACKSRTLSEAATERGATTQFLGGGELAALPTGTLFARVVSFTQAPATSFGSEKHQPGLIYVSEGRQRLSYEGGATTEIDAGAVAFLASEAHTHSNPGPDANHWYFFAVWPLEAKQLPPVNPAATVDFESPDLSSGSFPVGPYVETLRLVTLARGGQTWSHKDGGMEVTLVLSGALTINRSGLGTETLSAGRAAFTPANVPVQEVNAGSTSTRFLVFQLTARGHPFETTLQTAP